MTNKIKSACLPYVKIFYRRCISNRTYNLSRKFFPIVTTRCQIFYKPSQTKYLLESRGLYLTSMICIWATYVSQVSDLPLHQYSASSFALSPRLVQEIKQPPSKIFTFVENSKCSYHFPIRTRCKSNN